MEAASQQSFSRKELEFAVFCIENLAEKLGKTGDEIYKMLTEKSDILDMHCRSDGYLAEDIIENGKVA